MKPSPALPCLLAALLLFAAVPAGSADRVEIVLKNGGVVNTEEYFEEGGEICIYRYGALLRIPRATVVEIREIERGYEAETVTPDPTLFREKDRGTGAASPPARQDQESECERKIRTYEKQMRIYCAKAERAEADAATVNRMPDLPRANSGTISHETADRFEAHVKSKVKAARAGRTCDYYKDGLKYWREKCGR